MFTPGLIWTPLPILAPKKRNNKIFSPDIGFKGFRKNNIFTKYQIIIFHFDPGLYQELS
jgi:hypothetical protein